MNGFELSTELDYLCACVVSERIEHPIAGDALNHEHGIVLDELRQLLDAGTSLDGHALRPRLEGRGISPERAQALWFAITDASRSVNGQASALRLNQLADDRRRKEAKRAAIAKISADDMQGAAAVLAQSHAEPKATLGTSRHELGLAERVLLKFGKNLRFASDTRTWFVWSDRWSIDPDTIEVRRMVAKCVRALWNEVKAASNEEDQKDAKRFAEAMGKRSAIEGVVSILGTLEGITVAATQFDADPWLLGAKNGIVNLRTGELVPYSRELLITTCAGADYDPSATSDLWETYLEDALDEPLRSFVRRAVGYSLTGDRREEKAFLILGPTRCGKGTFADSVSGAFGQYAASADFKTFEFNPNETGDRPRPDLMKIAKRRFVATSEINPKARMDEARLKGLTGRDPMTVRELYGRSVELRPAFALWFAANNSPRISDDDAVWTRLVRIDFSKLAKVPVENRDPTMKARLTSEPQHLSAVLSWAVRGCLEWQRDGLAVPDEVQRSTRALRAELDVNTRFIEECFEFADRGCVSNEAIKDRASRWFEEDGEKLPSPKALAASIRKLAAARGRQVEAAKLNSCTRGWLGIIEKNDASAANETVETLETVTPAKSLRGRTSGEVWGGYVSQPSQPSFDGPLHVSHPQIANPLEGDGAPVLTPVYINADRPIPGAVCLTSAETSRMLLSCFGGSEAVKWFRAKARGLPEPQSTQRARTSARVTSEVLHTLGLTVVSALAAEMVA